MCDAGGFVSRKEKRKKRNSDCRPVTRCHQENTMDSLPFKENISLALSGKNNCLQMLSLVVTF